MLKQLYIFIDKVVKCYVIAVFNILLLFYDFICHRTQLFLSQPTQYNKTRLAIILRALK